MACCLNILDLGCYNSCEVIELPYATNLPYIVIFDYSNRQYAYEHTPIGSENVKIDLTKANENDCFKVSIIQNGNALNITIDNIAYDCFKIKTDYTTEIKPYNKIDIDCPSEGYAGKYDCWFLVLGNTSVYIGNFLNQYYEYYPYPLGGNSFTGVKIDGVVYNPIFPSYFSKDYVYGNFIQLAQIPNVISSTSFTNIQTENVIFSFTTKHNTITEIKLVDQLGNEYNVDLVQTNTSGCQFE